MFDLSSGEFRNISPGISGEPFMHLSFNPSDPLMLAVSKIVNGKSRIFRMNLGNSEFSAVTLEQQEEAPHWAEDGRIYFALISMAHFRFTRYSPMDRSVVPQ